MKLEEPWRGWPKVNDWWLDIRDQDGDLVAYFTFGAAYSARKFMEAIALGAKLELTSKGEIACGRYLIRANHAKELYGHKYTAEEQAWNLPVPYTSYAAGLAGVPLASAAERVQGHVAAATGKGAATIAKAAGKAPKTAPVAAARAAKGGPPISTVALPYKIRLRRYAQWLAKQAGKHPNDWRLFQDAAAKEVKQ